MTGDVLYLTHMHECIARIKQFTNNDRDTFYSELVVQDAVLRNLHTLSESSTHRSESLKAQFPDVPWREMRGFRNIVVHDYLGVDLDEIWSIIQHDLPPLGDAVSRMLKHVS